VRVLEHLISYVEYQYGDRVVGKAYRERFFGEITAVVMNGMMVNGMINRLDNFAVEIDILFSIYDDLIRIYEDDESLSWIARDNLKLPHCEKALHLLQPWNAYPDLNSSPRQIDTLDMNKNNRILSYLYFAEHRMAGIQRRKNEFHQAGYHCQRELFYARLYDGIESEKIKILCSALQSSHDLRAIEGKETEALSFAQEAYDCVTVAYNPVHPEVQQAAGMLIECLNHQGDIYGAKHLAQLTLDNLTDPTNGMNQQSEEVATGYANLSKVTATGIQLGIGGDLVKAEALARESIRIRTQIFDCNDRHIGESVGILATILQLQDKLGYETKELIERAIMINTRHYGPDGSNTAVAYRRLSDYHMELSKTQHSAETKREQLRLSQTHIKESVRIYTKILGPIHRKTKASLYQLSLVSRELSEA
jgi:hypothetical protein